jgi:hypothetical protein
VLAKIENYQNDDKKIEQMDMISLNKIVDVKLRSLHSLSRHINVTCRSYLTKTIKMLNWGKIMLKFSKLRYFDYIFTKWVILSQMHNFRAKGKIHSINKLTSNN